MDLVDLAPCISSAYLSLLFVVAFNSALSDILSWWMIIPASFLAVTSILASSFIVSPEFIKIPSPDSAFTVNCVLPQTTIGHRELVIAPLSVWFFPLAVTFTVPSAKVTCPTLPLIPGVISNAHLLLLLEIKFSSPVPLTVTYISFQIDKGVKLSSSLVTVFVPFNTTSHVPLRKKILLPVKLSNVKV